METTQRRTLLLALLLCSFVSQTLYLNVAVLLPVFVHDNFPGMSSFLVGLLMAIYPIAYLFAAPFIGQKLISFGRKNAVTTGIILMTISTVIFGLGGYAQNVYTFFWVSFVARLL